MKRFVSIASVAVWAWATLLMVAPARAEVLPPASQRFAAKTVSEVPSFQRHVLPLMGRLGCNGRACHGSFQGQGGFRLSLFGYDFKMDHDALLKGEDPRVDLKNPAKSLMLEKPIGNEDDHGGGHRLDLGSWQYKLLLKWIEAGAPETNEDRDPHFVKLEVTPSEIVFKKAGEKAQLKALSYWSDGTIEDVTTLCRFQTNDESIAKVSTDGQITSLGKGDTHVVAFYDNGVVPVAVLLPVTDKTGKNYPATETPTKVDELVVEKLRKLGIVQSDVCTDSEFIRRVSIDITGQLPTADEVKAFLADTSKDKRQAKIDELLDRPAYAAWWSTKLCDILGNSENQLRPLNNSYGEVASAHWYRWTYRKLLANEPYDRIIEGIVMAKGRTSENQSYVEYCKEMADGLLGKADLSERETMPFFWVRRNMRKPSEKALAFSYALLGVRLQCAECHKHPFDQWSQKDFQQFTAFFNRVDYGYADREAYREMYEALNMKKGLGNNEQNKIIMAAYKEGKPIPVSEVYVIPPKRSGKASQRDEKKLEATRVITPKVLGGEEVLEDEIDDPRAPLMAWLRQKDNPYFAKAIVNRVWASYFNVGIVEPPDDMNLANAPSNKELLDWLAESFIEHNYDLKWLHRTIAGSRTYQLSWQTNPTNEIDLRNYSHAIPRRLPAEVVLDAVATATAGQKELAERAADPVTKCATGMSAGYTRRAGSNAGYALSVFGKPRRETPCDCERSNEPSLLQTVFLRNDRDMFSLIDRKAGWLDSLGVDKAGAKAAESSKVAEQRKKLVAEARSVQSKLRETQAELAKLSAKKSADKQAKQREQLIAQEKQLYKRNKELSEQIKNLAEKEPVAKSVALPATDEAIAQAYLRTFSRLPDSDELANARQYVAESEDQHQGLRDVMWALLNSKEFLVNH